MNESLKTLIVAITPRSSLCHSVVCHNRSTRQYHHLHYHFRHNYPQSSSSLPLPIIIIIIIIASVGEVLLALRAVDVGSRLTVFLNRIINAMVIMMIIIIIMIMILIINSPKIVFLNRIINVKIINHHDTIGKIRMMVKSKLCYCLSAS